MMELVMPKTCFNIDGLPSTSASYTRAKNVLMTKYRKSSEVTIARFNTYIQYSPK